jgi:tetratricopeptide (TPR) repeat protein
MGVWKLGVALGLVALSGLSLARWAAGEPIPFEKLLKTATEKVNKNPNSAEARFFLARVNSYGFAMEGEEVAVYNFKEGKPTFPSYASVQVEPKKKEFSEKAIGYLTQSLIHYHKAAQLDSANAVIALGYGWMMEQYAVHFNKVSKDKGVSGFSSQKQAWDKAFSEYRRAFNISKDGDLKLTGRNPGQRDSVVSYEAASNLLRLDEAGKLKLTKAEKERYQKHLKAIEKIPVYMTPMILPINRKDTLVSLLDHSNSVPFDLDGTGREQKWNWVQPSAGILVWDPAKTGRINSGRQLFGNATFWMLFKDGFDALSALDTNFDGWLTGKELDGIRVWQDRNRNGISDKGEMIELRELKITGIKTKFTHFSKGMKTAVKGVQYSDGSFGPLYDWIAQSRS